MEPFQGLGVGRRHGEHPDINWGNDKRERVGQVERDIYRKPRPIHEVDTCGPDTSQMARARPVIAG